MPEKEKEEEHITNFDFRSVAFTQYIRENPKDRKKLIQVLDHFEQWHQDKLHPDFRKKQGGNCDR